MNKSSLFLLLALACQNHVVSSDALEEEDEELKLAMALSLAEAQEVKPIDVLNSEENGPQKLFVEEVPGDGDCGFHACGITRQKFQQQLMKILNQTDDPDKISVILAIKNAMDVDRFLEEDEIKTYLNGRFLQKSEYLIINMEQHNSLGHLLAKLNDFTLEVYLNDKHTGRENGIKREIVFNPGQTDVRRIIFNGVDHYDRLRVDKPPMKTIMPPCISMLGPVTNRIPVDTFVSDEVVFVPEGFHSELGLPTNYDDNDLSGLPFFVPNDLT